ncbi:putative F-box domain-containing protein [Tanacetum coccineum]
MWYLSTNLSVIVLLEELVEDILLRLAVEDLTRYKIVCKSWYSLISSHRFAKAHLKQHTRNSSNTNNELGHVRIAMPTYWKVPNEKLYKSNIWKVVGSSNGLVCFSTPYSGAPILVSNPRTRELRKLPMPPPLLSGKSMSRFFSFGYDSSTDDYRLVVGASESMTKETLFHVLSLKSNTWKLTGVFKYLIFYDRPGILFDGALHWLASDYNASERKRVILSFDLFREEFTAIIPEPVDSEYAPVDSYVGIVEDQLCIFFQLSRDNDFPCNNIWVMRSCKGERYWEKLPDNYEMKYQVVHRMKNLEFTLSMKIRVSFFCDDNKCLSRAWFHIKSPLFVPGLVSPYAGRPSHAKNNKTSVKSWSLKVGYAYYVVIRARGANHLTGRPCLMMPDFATAILSKEPPNAAKCSSPMVVIIEAARSKLDVGFNRL